MRVTSSRYKLGNFSLYRTSFKPACAELDTFCFENSLKLRKITWVFHEPGSESRVGVMVSALDFQSRGPGQVMMVCCCVQEYTRSLNEPWRIIKALWWNGGDYSTIDKHITRECACPTSLENRSKCREYLATRFYFKVKWDLKQDLKGLSFYLSVW